MKKTKFDKQLSQIHNEVLKCIEKIFENHNENGFLSLGEDGIDYDALRSIEYDWMYTHLMLTIMDCKYDLYDEEYNIISLYDLDTSALVNFYKEICNLYEK